MDIAKHDYTATPADIALVARTYFASQDNVGEGRTTYLRALVATSQVHLRINGSEPLKAIEDVNSGFYAEVLKEANAATPPRTPNRAGTINRRTNFARTSMTALRAWVRADGDLLKLVPKRVTKGALVVAHKARAPSVSRLKAQTGKRVEALLNVLVALGKVDRESAQTELDDFLREYGKRVGALKAKRSTGPRLEPPPPVDVVALQRRMGHDGATPRAQQ